MKKTIALMLVAFMAICLFSCGETGSENATLDPSSLTEGQKKALQEAEKADENVSYDELIDKLIFEGHDAEDSIFAADNCGIDWNARALTKAKARIAESEFSRERLIEQLKLDGYIEEQATYAADNCGADWNAEAKNAAVKLVDAMVFSRNSLCQWLKDNGYTDEQAAYGADNCGADWDEQARRAADTYRGFYENKEDLIKKLELEGFTHEQALAAVETN